MTVQVCIFFSHHPSSLSFFTSSSTVIPSILEKQNMKFTLSLALAALSSLALAAPSKTRVIKRADDAAFGYASENGGYVVPSQARH